MEYLSHFKALQYWKITWVNSHFAKMISHNQETRYLVRNSKNRFSSAKGKSFTFSRELPNGALDHSRRVVTPYLLFLQLANDLDFIDLIILGCMLCARGDNPWSPPYIPKAKLVKFVEAAAHYPGRKKALRALKYVEEGACSVMEIYVHLLLGLPNNWGGLNLKGGVFNYRVILDEAGQKALGKDCCLIDYCYPAKKMGFEYQSKFHEDSMDADSARLTALKQMHYDILPITKAQLYNSDKRAQILSQAMKMHGQKPRIRTENYTKRRDQIILALPQKPNQEMQT